MVRLPSVCKTSCVAGCRQSRRHSTIPVEACPRSSAGRAKFIVFPSVALLLQQTECRRIRILRASLGDVFGDSPTVICLSLLLFFKVAAYRSTLDRNGCRSEELLHLESAKSVRLKLGHHKPLHARCTVFFENLCLTIYTLRR